MAATSSRVTDLAPGDAFAGTLLLQDRELRRTPNGSVYMACLLSDRSGTVDARWWKATETAIRALSPGGFVRVEGKVQSHRGRTQMIVDTLVDVEPTSELYETLLPQTDQSIEEMWCEVVEILGSVTNRHLRRLLDAFVEDAELVARMKRVPAGTKLHHAVVGGLLEHTLQMLRAARAMADIYEELLHRDLLLAGVFFHDVAKTEELKADGTFAYTSRGNLVGHIAIGVSMLERRAAELSGAGEPFPPLLLDLLQHLVLSHHGTRERGSPKPPMIPEAFVLHALDDLDTRLAMVRDLLNLDSEPLSDFTHYHRVLDAKVFKKPIPLPGDESPER